MREARTRPHMLTCGRLFACRARESQFPAFRVPDRGGVRRVLLHSFDNAETPTHNCGVLGCDPSVCNAVARAEAAGPEATDSAAAGSVADGADGAAAMATQMGGLETGAEQAATEEAEADDEPHCSICLEGFSPGQFARSLPCRHTFHVQCIDAWLTQSSTVCPEDGMPVLDEASDDDEGDYAAQG